MELKIHYKPREYQNAMHDSSKRWKVFVWHRGSGKTTASLAELVRSALFKKGTYEFISPTYTQSKRNAREILKRLTNGRPNITTNESELKMILPNGSIIYLLGSDNPDSLRGLDFTGVVFDEYSQQPGNIFTEIVRPRLAITNGWAIRIGTPKGYNAFYDIYESGLKNEERLCNLQDVLSTGIVGADELEQARKSMTQDEYDQEFMCSFNASIKGAYYAKELSKARVEGRIKPYLYDQTKVVYTSRDLGMSDYTSICFAQVVGSGIEIIDYYENNNNSLDHYVKVLEDKGYRYAKHFFPHDAAQRSRQTGKSDIDFMRTMLGGEKCIILPKNEIISGINNARLLFNKISFDENKTKDLLDALAQYTQERDDKKGMFKNNPKHDWTSHAADSFRYLMGAYHFMNTSKPKEEYKPVFSKITGKPMINNNRKPFMGGSASVMQNIKL